jgi:SOS-response transcriptional repressor LexA
MRETSIVIFAEIENGQVIRENAGETYLPSDLLEVDELVFRYRGSLPSFGIECGDLLIVEPRKKAATGELVLARCGQSAFLGHWWAKNGLRELRIENETISGELTIVGGVNLIVRQS